MIFNRYLKREKFEIARELVISVLIATLVSSGFSYYLNVRLDERITERQFIYDYSRIFYDNPKYRDVSIAIEQEYLQERPFLRRDGTTFSEYDIDDYLYLLQEIWSFYQIGYISENVLKEQYKYFICVTFNSPSVQKYRRSLDTRGFANAHDYLDEMAKELGVENIDCRVY